MKKFRQSRLAQNETGQAMVEFALTVSITFLLIFGMIDLSRAIYTASVLQWAAQRGARAAIITPTQEVARAAAIEKMVGLDTDEVDVILTSGSGNTVTVNVSYEFDFIIPMIERITGDKITLKASASMVSH